MDFNASGLHQDNALMDVHQQIGPRLRGQFDLRLKDGVRLLDGLPFGGCPGTLRGRIGRKAGPVEHDGKPKSDEKLSAAQVRK